jgi:hypothetical protein
MNFDNAFQLNAWIESTPLQEKINWLENQGLARGYQIPEDELGREFLVHEVDRAIRAQFADLPYVDSESEGEEE